MKTIKNIILVILFISAGILNAQEYTVDASKSKLMWKGKKISSEHYGNIELKSGTIKIIDDKIETGDFIIDMTSITNKDLTDAEYNKKLVGHLKSDDFFSVSKFPTASLKITESSTFTNDECVAEADLTIKGITNKVKFTVKRDGKVLSALVTFDRSKYDVRYGSNAFFDNLGDKAIDNNITLDVRVVLTNSMVITSN